MAGEALALHVLESSLFHLIRHRFHPRFIPCSLVNRSDDIRIAFSALLLANDGDNYLLVRNLHRPESFGPFGGVFKYIDDVPFLHKLEFKPQTIRSSDDMKNDLRGFLPRKNLVGLVHWFKKDSKEKENATQCLTRELAEEIREAKLPKRIKCPDAISFVPVRTVQEGPSKVAGENYTQYRIFQIFKVDTSSNSSRKLIAQLIGQALKGQKNLMLASRGEIISGRSASGRIISHLAGYLFGSRRVRPDSPMFKA